MISVVTGPQQCTSLTPSNDDMRSELAKLNSTVQLLVRDNKELQVPARPPARAHLV